MDMDLVVKKAKTKEVNKCFYCQKVAVDCEKREIFLLHDGKEVFCEKVGCQYCAGVQYLPVMFGKKADAARMNLMVRIFGLKETEKVIKF